MYCGRSGTENPGLSVYLSLCLSVCGEPFAETTGLISTKPTQMGPLMVYLCAFEFFSLAYLMTSRRPCLIAATMGHYQGHRFDPIFLKFII